MLHRRPIFHKRNSGIWRFQSEEFFLMIAGPSIYISQKLSNYCLLINGSSANSEKPSGYEAFRNRDFVSAKILARSPQHGAQSIGDFQRQSNGLRIIVLAMPHVQSLKRILRNVSCSYNRMNHRLQC
eukprot:Gregarina_sp_Poly_1__10061@NODE_679_length_6812_cov_83_202669_g512_i0_p7_GENE_NODE_679_length_6812_cov_83_202669_g512_i0NODE_679_length_6812_cov_83_202669_g512_i0_p7_ORF_typecomplete_len127_score2_55_NODE_679_length_6812_cov_83_202669_g512_i038418